MSKTNGGPAFPFEEMHTDGTHYHSHSGLTLRDYFAAKAMQSLVHNRHPLDAAAESYEYADAMLKAREEGGAE